MRNLKTICCYASTSFDNKEDLLEEDLHYSPPEKLRIDCIIFILSLLEQFALFNPILLILENTQWINVDSLSLLFMLMPNKSGKGLMLVW